MSVINDSYSLSRGYDAGNRPLSHTFADGHSQVWTYDARNLVANLSYDGEQVLAQSHDAGYRLSTQTLGNGLSRQLTYARQDNLRTSDVTSDTGVISSLAWNYTYNVDKQVTAESTAGSFLDDSSFTAIMPSILSRHKVSTFFLQKVILKKAEILSPVVDPGDRLVSWTRPGQVAIGSRETENWSYDNAGNHNSVTRDGNTQNRTHNSENCRGIGGFLDRSNATCPAGVNLRVEEVNHNELINVDGDATTRDVKGNMTEDAEGNKYFYDLEHGRRIGGWVDKSRSDGGKARASQVGLASHNRINRIEMDGGDTIELEYDAMGRRVFRKNGSDETAFLWWGDQESSEHVSGAGQPVIQNDLWAHPTALNKICARAVDGDKNDIEWYHKNYLDHVYAVSDENTRRVGGCLDRSKATCPAGVNLRVEEVNHNGNIDEHYRYTAFGEVEIYNTLGQKLAQSAIGNTVLWNSRRFDQDTNLYYYLFRHYKAEYGRWLGRDPIGEGGGINLYGFVGNEPLGRWDVLGLAAKPNYDPGPRPQDNDTEAENCFTCYCEGVNHWTINGAALKKHWHDFFRDDYNRMREQDLRNHQEYGIPLGPLGSMKDQEFHDHVENFLKGIKPKVKSGPHEFKAQGYGESLRRKPALYKAKAILLHILEVNYDYHVNVGGWKFNGLEFKEHIDCTCFPW